MRRRHELHPCTVVINKAQKLKSKKAKQMALLWLGSKFPKVFDTSLSIQPLKIGIIEDILPYADEAGISRSKLREAIVIFTRRLDYLACLKAREWRIDLEGNPVALVTEEEAEKAALKIKKRIEKGIQNARKLQTTKKTEQPRPGTPSLDHHKSSHNTTGFAASVMAEAQTVSKATVTIKHKNTRSYDPETVARLKEKLGIARKEPKETEESV